MSTRFTRFFKKRCQPRKPRKLSSRRVSTRYTAAMREFSSIPGILNALRSGRMVVVVDDEERENEGDLVIAGEYMTERNMAFFIRHTGGVVCLAISNAIADQLDLPPMVQRNTSKRETPFTASIEAAENIATGISAKDRAVTVF